MIDAIEWREPQKPLQMQQILVEDNLGQYRVCKYLSLELVNEVVEFYMLQEPHETEIPPENVVRWQVIDGGDCLWHEGRRWAASQMSESEFYDLGDGQLP